MLQPIQQIKLNQFQWINGVFTNIRGESSDTQKQKQLNDFFDEDKNEPIHRSDDDN